MTQATHTPGPWVVEPCPDGLDIYSPKGRIAMINLDEPEECNDLLPNARLITAAPEMLASLRELLKLRAPNLLTNQERGNIINRAVDLLARIEGEA